MLLFKNLLRHYHDLMKCLAREPAPADRESAQALVEALRQLAEEADRLEAQLRQLTEKSQRRQHPSGPPTLRLVRSRGLPESPGSIKKV
ncbi:hypothetical protein V0R50_17745 [Pseudomonas sp. 148P]|uniref:Uncharacterized protein n=1 Tax=Pseudomonas ulcerans TaxID=3115852 RepID=A0ABU7HU53_9PSED|nr:MULTISPECIES: hypothetical protein [unclassified Pseudomonas]MEE1923899.1 hypothetical protein [Pseudomonas sp. 147P]MEE1935076.1 hypothetical protein [Pseudomonas sp. 148P]